MEDTIISVVGIMSGIGLTEIVVPPFFFLYNTVIKLILISSS